MRLPVCDDCDGSIGSCFGSFICEKNAMPIIILNIRPQFFYSTKSSFFKYSPPIFYSTNKLIGRWVMIIKDQSDFYILNDAIGLMQVVYYFEKDLQVLSSSEHLTTFTSLLLFPAAATSFNNNSRDFSKAMASHWSEEPSSEV